MALHYILDGYNIIKCVDEMADCSLEKGREALLKILSDDRPQGSLRNHVTVVFDGKDDVWGGCLAGPAKVIFTSGETADEYIKRAVEEAESFKNIIVVTNDKEIASYVRKLGAKVLGVHEFSAKKVRKANSKKVGAQQQGLWEKSKRITNMMEYRINQEFEKIWLKDDQ